MASVKGCIDERNIPKVKELSTKLGCRLHYEQMVGFDQNEYIMEFDVDMEPLEILELIAAYIKQK